MTPEEFDIDFDFDKEYDFTTDPKKNSTESDDFDLDAALARELGPDFDAEFEKEYAASQAALNEQFSLDLETPAAPETADMDQTRMFHSFADLEMDAEEQETPGAEEIPAAADPAAEEASEPAPRPRRERRPAKKGLDLSAITDKVDLQGLGEKFSAAGTVIADNGSRFAAALKDCKPGKMDKKQKRRFKDDVLPVLIGGAAFLMCMIFIIGSISRGFGSEERRQAALEASIAQAEAEAAAAALIENTLNTAAIQAAGYDYQAAINTLDSYRDAESGRELTEEMTAARAEYAAAMTDLVVWDDPASIMNLSFHTLVADPDRAYADGTYGSAFRKNFVTTGEFSTILEELYAGGYVLVNLDSCVTESTGADGGTIFNIKPIYLPQGKTPIMITETLVNYYDYMVESGGFASRLVIQAGEIKAEFVDAEGNTKVGDYDLVPILNSFIEAHPDFTYRGAKAILAVTGDEGIFGWRTNEDATLIDGVKDIVEVLRAGGYQIASNSFANLDYSGKTSAAQITADLDLWASEVTPVLGEVDIMIIAKGSGIRTRGTGFKLMEEAGFHYILDCTDTPGGELTNEYFHQHRIMVTGENLDSGMYDAYFTLADTQDTNP